MAQSGLKFSKKSLEDFITQINILSFMLMTSIFIIHEIVSYIYNIDIILICVVCTLRYTSLRPI